MVFGDGADKMSLGINAMQKIFNKRKGSANIPTENKVKEYIYKYLKELQRHFDLSDRIMRRILLRIYKDTSGFSLFIKQVKKKLSHAKIQICKNKGK